MKKFFLAAGLTALVFAAGSFLTFVKYTPKVSAQAGCSSLNPSASLGVSANDPGSSPQVVNVSSDGISNGTMTVPSGSTVSISGSGSAPNAGSLVQFSYPNNHNLDNSGWRGSQAPYTYGDFSATSDPITSNTITTIRVQDACNGAVAYVSVNITVQDSYNKVAGSLTISSISPNPADSSITVLGSGTGGSWTGRTKPCSGPNIPGSQDATVYYKQLLTPTTYQIDGGGGGSYTLAVTQTGQNHVLCTVNTGQEWGYSFSFSNSSNISGLSNGTHTLTVFANDESTGQTISASQTFTVQHAQPKIQLSKINSTITCSSASCPTGDDVSVINVGQGLMSWNGGFPPGSAVTQVQGALAGGSGLLGGATSTGSFIVINAKTQATQLSYPSATITEACQNCDASQNQATLQVNYNITPPKISSFNSSSNSVTGPNPGSVTLSWSSQNANTTNPVTDSSGKVGVGLTSSDPHVNITNLMNSANGSATVSNITQNTTFTLSIKGIPDNDNQAENFDTKTVTVAFTSAPTFSLNLTKAGTGTGTVTDNQNMLNCNPSCSSATASYNQGTTVNLTAAPSQGSTFVGWGGDCSGTGSCSVTMNQNHNVTATFNTVSGTLTCSPSNQTVNPNSPAGLTAGGGTAPYSWASPNGSPFSGSGASYSVSYPSGGSYTVTLSDSGGNSANCQVSVNSPPAVSLTANPAIVASGQSSTLTWSSANAASCSASASPSNANWTGGKALSGSQSSGALTNTTTFTLTCTNSAGSSSSNATVTVSISPPTTYTLAVTVTGSGSGSVTSNPAGINCSSGTCSASFANNTNVGLIPAASGGSTFAGWSGDCSGMGCVVTMNQNHNVTATFSGGKGSGFSLSATPSCNAGTSQVLLSFSNFPFWTWANRFDIYRNGALLASFPAGNSTTYTDMSVVAGNSYTYQVNYYYIFGYMGQTNTASVTAANCGSSSSGSITVNATLNGSPWTGPVSYSLNGPGTQTGSSAPQTFSSQPQGVWTLNYTSGGPGGTLSITPNPQTLSGGGSLTFTMSFANLPASPGGPPIVDNSNTNAQVACGKVRVSWVDQSTNETGFKIFMDGNLQATAPGSSPASATGGNFSYDFTPPDSNNHNYSVAATSAGGDSAQAQASNNPVAAIACQANLGASSKVLTTVNGSAYTSSTALKLNDTIVFTITVDNTQGTKAASGLSIVDNFTNLQIPSGGLNAVYNGTNLTQGSGSGHYTVSGTAPNQTINFNLTGSGFDVPAGSLRTLTLTGQIAVPAGFTGSNSRMQNSAVINFTNGSVPTKTVSTPLLIFSTTSGAPNINEVAPGQ